MFYSNCPDEIAVTGLNGLKGNKKTSSKGLKEKCVTRSQMIKDKIYHRFL